MKPAALLEGINPPGPDEIRAARAAAGLTQLQAADLAGLDRPMAWSDYECGRRKPDLARWALFLLAIGQHPRYAVARRRPAGVSVA